MYHYISQFCCEPPYRINLPKSSKKKKDIKKLLVVCSAECLGKNDVSVSPTPMRVVKKEWNVSMIISAL